MVLLAHDKRRQAAGCLAALLAAAAMLALAWVFDPLGCRPGVVISVRNDTNPPAPLTEVYLAVKGDSVRLGAIAPGANRTVWLHPQGESGVTLRFVLAGRETSASGEYVEEKDGCKVDLVVRERGVTLVRTCCGFRFPCYGELKRLHE